MKEGESDGSYKECGETHLIPVHSRGRDADGNAINKSYVYSNVKPDAEDEKLMAVGKALGGLFDNDMTGLVVVERAELIEE